MIDPILAASTTLKHAAEQANSLIFSKAVVRVCPGECAGKFALGPTVWERAFAASNGIDSKQLYSHRVVDAEHKAIAKDLENSVTSGLLHRVFAEKLGMLQQTLRMLHAHAVVSAVSIPGDNCILGFHRVQVHDNERFQDEIMHAMQSEKKLTIRGDYDTAKDPDNCVYNLLQTIGVTADHGGPLRKTGGERGDFDSLGSVDSLQYDKSVLAHLLQGLMWSKYVFPMILLLRCGSLFAGTEVIHRSRSRSPLHFDHFDSTCVAYT